MTKIISIVEAQKYFSAIMLDIEEHKTIYLVVRDGVEVARIIPPEFNQRKRDFLGIYGEALRALAEV